MFSWAVIRGRVKSAMAQLIPSQSASIPAKTPGAQTHIAPKPSVPKTQKPSPHKKKHLKEMARTAWMRKDIGELVTTFTPESIEPDTNPVTSETGFETLCSYNWQKGGKAILVPGGPRRWKVPTLPFKLKPDTGYTFIDQHAFHAPRYPFEPSFQALAKMNPGVQLDNIDIITNRNSLRKLLKFTYGAQQDAFCIGLRMVKNTLFLTRKVQHPRQFIGTTDPGYGYNFEEAFTKAEVGLEQSSSHHRVIRYRLGGLDCVVRFEVDACYKDPEGANSADFKKHSVDEITAAIAQATVDEPSLASQNARLDPGGPKATTTVQRSTIISPYQLAEIKLRKAVRFTPAVPQLWFGRTPYLLVGKHDTGLVKEIKCYHVESHFTSWEKDNQDRLRKLVSLLAELKRITYETEKKAAMLLFEDRGAPLQVFETKNDSDVLPRAIIDKHWSRGEDVQA